MDNKKFGGLSFEDLDRAAALDQTEQAKTSQTAPPKPEKYAEWIEPTVPEKTVATPQPVVPVKPVAPPQPKTPVKVTAASQPSAPVKPAAPTHSTASVKAAVTTQPAAPVKPATASTKSAASVQAKPSNQPQVPSKTSNSAVPEKTKIESPGFKRHIYGCISTVGVGIVLLICSTLNYVSRITAYRGDIWGPMFFMIFSATVFSLGIAGLLLTKIMDPTGQAKGTLKENIVIVRTTIGLSIFFGDLIFTIIAFTILNYI